MFTLQSYKDQCYNVGSPSPTALSVSPAIASPSVSSEFTFPPKKRRNREPKTKTLNSGLFITPSKPQKRKTTDKDLEPSENSSKKAKMISKEEFDRAMTEERQQNQSNMDKILASIADLSNQLKTCNDDSKHLNDEVKNERSWSGFFT